METKLPPLARLSKDQPARDALNYFVGRAILGYGVKVTALCVQLEGEPARRISVFPFLSEITQQFLDGRLSQATEPPYIRRK